MLIPVPSLKNLAARSCTIEKLQDAAAASLILVVVAALGAMGVAEMLSELLPQ